MSLTQDGYRTETHTEAAVDTDVSGDVTISVTGLRHIEGIGDVDAYAAGGYVANVQSVSGNQVTVRVYQGGGAATELAAVTDTVGVTDVTLVATGW